MRQRQQEAELQSRALKLLGLNLKALTRRQLRGCAERACRDQLASANDKCLKRKRNPPPCSWLSCPSHPTGFALR